MEINILNIIFLLSFFLIPHKNYCQPYTKKDEILDRKEEQEKIKKYKINKIKECHYQYTLSLFSPEIKDVEIINNIDKVDSLLFNSSDKYVFCKTSIYDKNGYYHSDYFESNNT